MKIISKLWEDVRWGVFACIFMVVMYFLTILERKNLKKRSEEDDYPII